jgi:hypothetical protein
MCVCICYTPGLGKAAFLELATEELLSSPGRDGTLLVGGKPRDDATLERLCARGGILGRARLFGEELNSFRLLDF